MTDIFRLEKNFAKDLSNLHVLVGYSAEVLLQGSFSDRRPDLGPMFVCRSCGRRRRANAEKCCSPRFATTQRAWDAEQGFHQVECPSRETATPFSKAFIKKFRHKRHGQSRAFKIRQLTHLFQTDAILLKDAADEIQVKMPEAAHIPTFAERYWFWKQKRIVRAERVRAKRNRQFN